VRDIDSGNPIPAATLSVFARDRGGSPVEATITRVTPELFRCRLDFPRSGNWSVRVRVGGDRVVPTSFSFDVEAAGRSTVDASSSTGPDVAILVALSLVVLVGAAVAVVLVVRRRRRLPG
jgi:hypothetical protein